MKNILKLELKRAFSGKGFIGAIVIGIGISLSHFILYLVSFMSLDEMYSYNKPMISPSILFGSWMGGNNYNLQSYLFYLLLPIIATLPYVYSYYQDKKFGFIKNVLTRTNPSNYYLAKWIAVFLSAGVVIVIPLLLNLVIFMTTYPSLKPQMPSFYYTIIDSSMFSNLFLNHPFLYILFYIVLDFIFAGLIATIGLIIEFFTDYLFIILLFPFLFYIFSSSVLEMLDLQKFSPNFFLKPSYGESSFLIILVELIALFCLSFFPFMFHGRQRKDY